MFKYIQAAEQACLHTHKICLLGSANRCNGRDPKSYKLAEAALIREKQGFDKQIEAIQDLPEYSEDQKNLIIIQLLARIARKAEAGNCQEMAAVAFLFLMEQGIRPLELVSIPTHTFLVIGRDPKTPIQSPDKWNEDAIICDPWQGENPRPYDSEHSFFNISQESMIYPPKRIKDYKALSVGFALYLTNEAEIDLLHSRPSE